MLKYYAAVAASKGFSLNRTTKRAYRRLGNVALERSRLRTGLEPRYVERARRLVDHCDENDVLAPGDRVLELGTGWLHWEATVLALFFDVEATLYDVSDNRLFAVYQAWVGEFGRDAVDAAFGHLDAPRRERAKARAAEAASVGSFEELYGVLGLEYLLEPSGTLAALTRRDLALVVSADVLEHVPAEVLDGGYLERVAEALRPGAWSVHQIDLVDHYHYFDASSSTKNYYRHEDDAWRRWFESDVQYINRIQRPEWLQRFERAGFELVDETSIEGIAFDGEVASPYAGLSVEDRRCDQLLVTHRTRAV